MNVEYSNDAIPARLTTYVQASQEDQQFRRRAVLAQRDGQWELISCTIEGFLPGESTPEPSPSRKYDQVVLYEDWLIGSDCLCCAADLNEGKGHFGDIYLRREGTSNWSTERVPLKNDYMARAGSVIGLRFGQSSSRIGGAPLLAVDQPFYPDIDSAARDWLPFRVYHGDSDGRNNQVFFLLPEARAFFDSAAFSTQGKLNIVVAGTEIHTLSLLIKGAYWEGKLIRHFEANVCASRCEVSVPNDVERLQYYLIDRCGTVYDSHTEDRFSGMAADAGILGSIKRTLSDLVREALDQGEGTHVEFKPFVGPAQKFGSNNQKTKLLEIVTTVVAFANTGGGRIFLGVDDDCSVTGIDQKLCEWASASFDESTINRYLGALKSKIKDLVSGDVALRVWHTQVDGVIVGVVEVPPAVFKPIAVRQDNYLYARTGASNRKVPPDQWRIVLEPSNAGTFGLI